MGVDLRRRHVLVAEQLLHGADVVASFKQVRGERMTQRVAGGGLVDRRQLPRRPHGTLQHAVVDMMPPQLPRTRIDRALRREEHVLPARLASRVREFARQRVRQPDLTETFRQVRRSEEHTSELQSLMRISYAVFRLKKKRK